jgi:hypothetical protein
MPERSRKSPGRRDWTWAPLAQAVSLDPYKLYRFMSHGQLTIPRDGTMVES